MNWVVSRMNESGHVTHQRVAIWSSHVKHYWDMSHMSCNVRMGETKMCLCVCVCVCVYGKVMPHINESGHIYIWMSHVTYEWVSSYSHKNESRHATDAAPSVFFFPPPAPCPSDHVFRIWRDLAHSYVNVTWLINVWYESLMCDMTHWCVTRLFHIWSDSIYMWHICSYVTHMSQVTSHTKKSFHTSTSHITYAYASIMSRMNESCHTSGAAPIYMNTY